ncbi:MAG: SPASM domain-containing protein, partial [Patescibacteria group bacterium]
KFSHGIKKDGFGKVLKNIRTLVKQKQRLDSKCTVGIGYLTCGKTKREILKFALLCRDLGVDYAQFWPLLSYFGQGGIDYSAQEHKGIIREIEKALKLSRAKTYQVLYSKHKYDNIKNSRIQRPYQKCYGHNFAAVVSADKKMYLCCHFRGVEKYCLGDLGKNSLKEIWRSPRRKEAYESIDLSMCPPLCRCDTFNAVIWNIKQEKVHPNFI